MGCARTRRSVGPLRWTWRSTSSTACWSWDARPTSASPNLGRDWGQCAPTPDRGTVTIPSPSSHIGPDQHSPWFLERAIGMKIVVERAGVHIAQFAADLWNAPGLVGHQILGIAQSLGGHDPWPAATAPAGAGGGQAFLKHAAGS